MSTGNAIRFFRTKKNWNQAELAEHAGYSVSYLSLLERDQRTLTFEVASQLCEAFETTLIHFIFVAYDNSEKMLLDDDIAAKLSLQVLR